MLLLYFEKTRPKVNEKWHAMLQVDNVKALCFIISGSEEFVVKKVRKRTNTELFILRKKLSRRILLCLEL